MTKIPDISETKRRTVKILRGHVPRSPAAKRSNFYLLRNGYSFGLDTSLTQNQNLPSAPEEERTQTETLFTNEASHSRGLTIIELLAVIAIIGILAAILLPITARARDSAKVAACQSNLRALGTAVYLFAADHEDHTPPNINPEVDPPRLDDLSGSFVGGPSGDVRTLGWLIPEEFGGPPKSPNRYLDTPSVLFCPSLSGKVYAASDEYKRPEEISSSNPIRRTGYAWIYRIPRKEDAHNYGDGYFAENPNHKVTVANQNVPLIFDFGWTKGYGDQGPIISFPSHRNVINVLHLGGHITTVTHAEANQYDGYDALYRFLAGDPK